jgi:hypothetical protein
MRTLPLHATDDEILEVARDVADLLATDRYDDALKLVDARGHWTPALLRSVIRNYGSVEPRADGSAFRVTSLRDARGGPSPRHEVDRQRGSVYVWFDLPLNGEWSDLTATFEATERDGGLILVLDDVHVM